MAFGTYDARTHPRVGVLVDGLRAHGFDVTELNEPLLVSTDSRVSMLQQPWRAPSLAGTVMRRWLALGRRTRHLKHPPDVVLVGYLGHFDVHLARRLFPRSIIVLDQLVSGVGTAKDRGESNPTKLRVLGAIDNAALSTADIVVTDTDEQRDSLPHAARRRSVVVPVGASQSWFRADPQIAVDSDMLSLVFFGLFTPLQGTPVIADAVRRVLASGTKIRVTLIGRGQDWPECRRLLAGRQEVTWHDWVSSEELPQMVAQHDVCLGIFGTSPKALSVVPTKVYQGCAAGCALVTSDTPPQRRALGDAALFVPPGDPAALADHLAKLEYHREAVRDLRRAAGETASKAFTPGAVVEPLVEALRTARERKSR